MDKFVKEIFDSLVKILPSDWGKIVLHLELGKNNHSLLFFVSDKCAGKYYSFADLQRLGIFSKIEFQNVSMRIGNVSRAFQQTFEKKWMGYTLVISRDGMSYVDFEQQATMISNHWKEKYLN